MSGHTPENRRIRVRIERVGGIWFVDYSLRRHDWKNASSHRNYDDALQQAGAIRAEFARLARATLPHLEEP